MIDAGRTSISGVNQPSQDEIIAAVGKSLDADAATVISWLTTFVRYFDPKAAAERLAARGGA